MDKEQVKEIIPENCDKNNKIIRRTKMKYKVNRTLSYKFWQSIARVWARNLNFRMDPESQEEMSKIEGPVLALGAHVNAVDFLGILIILKKKKFAFVASASLFYIKLAYKLFHFLGNVIPRKQFTVDVESVRAMKFFVDNGISIGMCPEGRVSIEGKSGHISDSTIKLIKFLGVPVVFTHVHGGYLQRPRYANKMRNGMKLKAEAKLLLTKEQVNNFSFEEIKNIVDEAFKYSEMEYQEINKLQFVPKSKKVSLAYGLDFLLHQCPKCLTECAMVSTGNEMKCNFCGNAVTIDSFGKIKPKTKLDECYDRIDKWYDFQKQKIKDAILANPEYERKTKVILHLSDDKNFGFKRVDEGTLSLNKDGFSFSGKKYPILKFSIKQSPSVAVRLGKSIDFFVNYDIFRFTFEFPGEPTQFNIATELLHKLFYE